MLTFQKNLSKAPALVLATLALALTVSTLTFAQQNDDNNTTQDQSATEQKENIERDDSEKESSNEEQSKNSKPSKSPETFIPSEEISKDLSVSFPVDI